MSNSLNLNRAIFSTGIGKLHFIESATALHKAGYPIEIIMGWRPQVSDQWINLIGKLIGQNNLAKRLAARRSPDLNSVPVHSCTLPEAYAQMLIAASKYRMLGLSHAQSLGFTSFGRASKKYLRGAGIFHVRSGAGQGGAIETARKAGMKIVVDHSIAHPAVMREVLETEYKRYGVELEFQPENALWKLVLLDCEQADLLQVNSDYVKKTFIEQGYSEERIHVAYLGVRKDFFGLKRSYERGKELRLLFTGSFDLRKGARVILEALEILQKKAYPVRLDVVGSLTSGEYPLREHPELKNIHFHSFVPQDELKRYLAEAELFVFPTFAEGSSRSAMEAMAAGLTVVTTRSCGVPIEHGKTGWYVPVGDPQSLADAIRHLGDDASLRETIGRGGAQSVAENYTWEHYARAVIEGYQKLSNTNISKGRSIKVN